ncbi:1,4-beta-xylanase [Bifidobacterium tissieri]|nr:1,4-beta-xylanase [Bifidobacterium tissieri]
MTHDESYGYLFAHFTGTEQTPDDEQIYFALSRDGLRWHDLRAYGDPVLRSPLGERGVRDPYIVREPDGRGAFLIATDLSIHHRGGDWATSDAKYHGSTSLVVWHSNDLAHWDEPWLLDVASSIPDAGYAWAPEAMWDERHGHYMLYWATLSEPDNTIGDPQNMYLATTTDFRSITTPVKWVDRERACIDVTMMRVGDWYYRASAGDGIIHIDRASNPYAVSVAPRFSDETGDADSWSFVADLDAIFAPSFNDICGGKPRSHELEGPELFRFNPSDAVVDGRSMPFGLIADRHAEHDGYIAFRSADLASADATDWAYSDVDFGTLKKRHGTILPVSEQEYRALETLAR